MADAMGGGRMSVITWLQENDITRTKVLMKYFVHSLDVFNWALHTVGIRDNGDEYLEALKTNGCTDCGLPTGALSNLMINHANCEAYQLALDHGYITIHTRIGILASKLDFTLIRWLHTKDLQLPMDFVCSRALKEDRLDILQWALERGFVLRRDQIGFDTSILSSDVMEWMADSGLACKHL
ncbi:hypothetical protein PROFUN_06955 [Planoprotostelium fungivorum]|uniref:Ankyrin repeat protein n=1 Tax=Planoprotostelium fungivorum TaxID=1890364 RepID=A0A2P6NN85_9EUKA|nr:hypothetical protein PROFUN_06955 [Planoprotostelium fungivorum]